MRWTGNAVFALREALGLSRAQFASIVFLAEEELAILEQRSPLLVPPFSSAYALLSFGIRKMRMSSGWAMGRWGDRIRAAYEAGGRVWALRHWLEGP